MMKAMAAMCLPRAAGADSVTAGGHEVYCEVHGEFAAEGSRDG
ncbi:hypothetical protein SAMN05421538_10370 [Paracoccus isoporae]|uniref:Uncharacterized protein n=1 Tax=Paracoccus isoporae TaxID=591205 RepID=A0A1G6YU91_9RHOB|nr:hypothetical protein [Paracoccus isoporae]SDD93852.1 hypothetical protein SAMN05421538_10370 [Paracoccus isoporae]